MAGPTVRSNHNAFQCAFHVVWSPKYRRSVLVPPVDERLKPELIQSHRALGVSK
jgi:putative transposase